MSNEIILLGDTHFDVFSGIKQERMYAYQEKFFQDTFFPYIIKNKIKTVVQLGDLFDKRTSISQRSIAFAKRIFFDVLKKNKIELHVLTGNHDAFFRDSLDIVTASQVLGEYNNIFLYNEPTQVKLHDVQYSFIPWICRSNESEIAEFIKNDTSEIAFGHLELAGARLSKHSINEHGTEPSTFKKYKRVYSGHFHTKSVCGNVEYIGVPYELTRVDSNDPKSFNVIKHGEPDKVISNPHILYEQITINDAAGLLEAATGDYSNKYIEMYVNYIAKPETLSKFAEKLNKDYDMYDCQIIPKKEQEDNELLVVDTSMVKNNEELILSYGEINNLKESVIMKLKSLYNTAIEN